MREAARRFLARGTNLAEATATRENNFDVVRLFAALLVLFSHSFPLAGRSEPFAPHTLGTVGVELFFVTSGMLIARSWFGDPCAKRFFAKRFLRIMPALFVAVLVTAFVIGPLYTSLSLGRYFGSSIPFWYSRQNILLQTDYMLPSVFAGTPLKAANGSLWTLPIEAYAYALVAMVGLCGALRSRRVLVYALLLFIYMNVFAVVGEPLQLISLFLGGVVLYACRHVVPLRADLAAVLLFAWIETFSTRYTTAVGIVALPYVVAFVAYRSPKVLRRLTAAGDLSYGVYLYAFPIQQALIASLGTIRPLLLFATATPIVWLVALASWRLVEAPALRLKPRAFPAAAASAHTRPSLAPLAELRARGRIRPVAPDPLG